VDERGWWGHRVLATGLEGVREAASSSSGSLGRPRHARGRRVAVVMPGAAWGLLLAGPEETGCRREQALQRLGPCRRVVAFTGGGADERGRHSLTVGSSSGSGGGRSVANPKGRAAAGGGAPRTLRVEGNEERSRLVGLLGLIFHQPKKRRKKSI